MKMKKEHVKHEAAMHKKPKHKKNIVHETPKHKEHEHEKHKMPKAEKVEKHKMKKVMHEFKEGALHSGSKKGPVVSNPKQAVAIAFSESRKANKKRK